MSIPVATQEDARRAVEVLPDHLNIGPPHTHAGLTVFPLSFSEPVRDLGYITLDEALATGKFRITEVSAAGSVPELRVINEGDAPVLLLDGEELIGAKQNRVPNVTILVPAHQTIVVPVSCVESGRWAHQGEAMDFCSAKHVMYARARKASSSDVRLSARVGQGYRSNQGRVWDELASKSDRLGTRSNTSAMRDMFKAREHDMDRYVAAFNATDSQVGAAFCIGDTIAGVEVFDRPSTLRSLLPKLLRSYAMDAIELKDGKHDAPGVSTVEAFVRDVARSNKEVRAAVGLGEDVRLSAPTLVGGALVYESNIVHLSVFPLDNAQKNPKAPEAPTQPRSWLSSLRRRRNRRQ